MDVGKEVRLYIDDGLPDRSRCSNLPSAFFSHEEWSISRIGQDERGVLALVSGINWEDATARITFQMIAGAFLDITLSRFELEALRLIPNECVVLVPRNNTMGIHYNGGPTRVRPRHEWEEDCTQHFPTGP